MDLPNGFNMHKINDHLNRHEGLSHAEFRVAYYTVHADYGRRKDGLFWEGAASVERRIGVGRKWVKKTWKKMEAKGWLTDTGQRRGRATVWRIEYPTLWNDAMGSESPRLGSESRLMGTESRNDGHSVPVNGHSLPTTPPKEASEETSPKEVSSEADLTESVSSSSSLQQSTTPKPQPRCRFCQRIALPSTVIRGLCPSCRYGD